MRCIEDLYTVVGYDKDNDVYEKYGEYTVPYFALIKASEMTGLMNRGELKRKCSDGTMEPIDWIEIYKNMDTSDEEKVWSSYDQNWREKDEI
jgi:hypothetical protein